MNEHAAPSLDAQTRNALVAKVILIDKWSIISTSEAGSGHPSSASSIGHLVAVLMYKQMRWLPGDPWNLANDRLVLSEGHAVPAIYPAYADLGGLVGPDKVSARKLKLDDVRQLRKLESVLDGHPNPALGFPFFDAATGSLGMGASVAAGLGLAGELDKTGRRVYVIIGDGESREGQVWEAVDFIAGHNIRNVTLIFNANGQGQADHVAEQQSAGALIAKLAAAGLEVADIDGHDVDQIYAALNRRGERPVAVVARTLKGWGSSELLNGNWHGKPLPPASVEKALADLNGKLAELGIGDPTKVKLVPPKPAKQARRVAQPVVELGDPDFVKLCENHPLPVVRKLADGIRKGKLATRRAYGLALAELGRLSDKFVALDGDVSNSTFAEYFAWMHPNRFFECKIAEQNMVSTAAGLAAGGKVPFASTFGKFFSRALDQVELAVISGANVKLCGSHIGVTLGADGPSQMALTDVAFFRSFGQKNVALGQRTTPGSQKVKLADAAMVVLTPADAVSAWKLTELMANHEGACYLRTMRPDTPMLYKPSEKFPLGGFKVLHKGGKTRLVIAAMGYMVHESLKAAEMLAAKGIEAVVADCYCLPMDAGKLLKLAEGNGKLIVTAEDNYVGGLGSELAEAAAADGKIRVHSLAVRRVPKSGTTPEEMLAMCGIDAASMVKFVQKLLGR